jgi:hypothetical protein
MNFVPVFIPSLERLGYTHNAATRLIHSINRKSTKFN